METQATTGHDLTVWIKRVIENDPDYVSEEWIRDAYIRSVSMKEHNPLNDLILLHRSVRTNKHREKRSKIQQAFKLLCENGFVVSAPDPQPQDNMKTTLQLVLDNAADSIRKYGRSPTHAERLSR